MTNKLTLALLRISLGLLFLITGIGKLINPSGVAGMLSGIGFPATAVFAWILLLSEIIFGVSLLIGYNTKFAVWPLFVILIVATILVVFPSITFSDPTSYMTLIWHLVGLAGLMTIKDFGPGKIFN